jgi:hypothetical protein
VSYDASHGAAGTRGWRSHRAPTPSRQPRRRCDPLAARLVGVYASGREALAAFQGIQKANADWDVAAWERLSAPDHAIINPDGSRASRAQRVAALKAPPPAGAAPPVPAQNVRIIVKGDVAAVTWTAGTSRSLKVLARSKSGQWQQVLQQNTPIVPVKK